MKRRAVAVLTLAAVLLTACGGQEAAKGLKTFTEPGTRSPPRRGRARFWLRTAVQCL